MPLNLERLRAMVERSGMTHAELARRSGMLRPNLSRLLTGSHDPRLGTLEKLASALGCRVSDIIR